ncbi:MAG: prepilin-type N-terminal cleavage/methylation domain-containing protein [Acidiferrobacterales bacterium]
MRLRREQGFTLLELVVVIAVIAVLLTVVIDRLWIVQKEAEATAMEQVLGTLRSALGMKVASDLVNDDIADLHRLAGSNPMQVLAQTPRNYLGAFNGVNPASIPGGHWYFDRHSRMLIYRVRNRDYFSGGLGSPARAGFTIRIAQARHVRGEPVGAMLVAVTPYRWGPRRVADRKHGIVWDIGRIFGF